MAAPQKTGQKRFATPYGTTPGTELSGRIIRNQALVPLVDIPTDVPVVMIVEQNIPVFLWLAQPLNDALAPVLNHNS